MANLELQTSLVCLVPLRSAQLQRPAAWEVGRRPPPMAGKRCGWPTRRFAGASLGAGGVGVTVKCSVLFGCVTLT